MAREKKPVHKVQMTEGKRQIIQQLLQEYDIETADDIQAALKGLLLHSILFVNILFIIYWYVVFEFINKTKSSAL